MMEQIYEECRERFCICAEDMEALDAWEIARKQALDDLLEQGTPILQLYKTVGGFRKRLRDEGIFTEYGRRT